MALGVMSAVGTLGAAAGGIIGGFAIKQFGWPIIYWISGTLSVIGLFLVLWTVPETPRRERKPFDYFGSALLFSAVGTLLSVTTLIANLGFLSPYTLLTLLIGIILSMIFWQVEKRSPHPFIELSLFKNRRFILPLILSFFLTLCYQGVLYSNAFFVSSKPGGGPELAGMLTMYVYVAGAISGLIGGKLVDMIKMKHVILASIGCFFVGAFVYSTFHENTPFWYIAMTVIILVMGITAMAPACMKMALAVVPEEKLSMGSGTYTMIRDLGSPAGQTTGLAVFGTLSASSLVTALTQQAKESGVSEAFIPALVEAAKSSGSVIDPKLSEQFAKLGLHFSDIYQAAQNKGMIIALNSMSYIVIGVTILIFIVAFWLPNIPVRSSLIERNSSTE